jgi:hypothetical protein
LKNQYVYQYIFSYKKNFSPLYLSREYSAILKTGAIIFVLHVRENQAPINKKKQRDRAGVIYGINLSSPTLRVNSYLVNNTKKVLPIDDLKAKFKAEEEYNFNDVKTHPGSVTRERYKMIKAAINGEEYIPTPKTPKKKQKTT